MASSTCPRCGRDNDPSAATCQGCGHSLLPARADRACAACGAILDPTFRFCAQCGRPVAEAAARSAPPPLPAEGPPVLARAARQPPPPRPPTPVGAGARAALRLVQVRHDGLPGVAHVLGPEGVSCGRSGGELRFSGDPTISPEHARFSLLGEQPHVEDLGSANGTFIRLRAPRPLGIGDEIRLGRQLLRVEPMPSPAEGLSRPWGSPSLPYRARLIQLLEGGGTGEIFPLRDGENAIGREAGSICFPGDRYVSARHARIDVTATGMVLFDLGSSNGTFVRVTERAPITAGDQILIGMQLLRVE